MRGEKKCEAISSHVDWEMEGKDVEFPTQNPLQPRIKGGLVREAPS
jgi:hypothetical protein